MQGYLKIENVQCNKHYKLGEKCPSMISELNPQSPNLQYCFISRYLSLDNPDLNGSEDEIHQSIRGKYYFQIYLRNWDRIVIFIEKKCLQYSNLKKKLLYRYLTVPLVLLPNGIAPTFLKFDSWSPGAGFIPIISTKSLN